MREWISLLNEDSSEDFSFVDSLIKMLNMDKKEVESIIEKLNLDDLSNLVDATMNNDQDTAQKIISDNSTQDTIKDNSASNASEDNEAYEESMNNLIMKNNKTAKRSREDYSIDETADSLTLNIGDKVFVDDEEGTVKIPSAPGNTIGVMIDGELQMINKEKVHVKEGVLGMTPMPGLQRMQELAGIKGNVPSSPSEIEPVDTMDVGMEPVSMDEPMADEPMDMDMEPASMDYPMDMEQYPIDEPMEDGASAIENAISDIESHIPNVSISDYKTIVARLKALVSMAENAGRTALSESKKAKAAAIAEAEAAQKKEIPEDKIVVKQPKEHDADTSGSEVTRKTLMDYIREQDEVETLGANRADALKTIQNRLGQNGNPQAANQAFSKLQSTGKIKQQNGTFTMNAMDDEDFNNSINQDGQGN